MKTQFSEEPDVTAHFNTNAADTKQHKQTQQPNSLGDFAAVVALSIAFCTLVLLSLRAATPQPTVVQSFELPPRPIWINNLPFAPRDGLVPDFGQTQRPQLGYGSATRPPN
jgi:hypothetical protein